jgi:hypothetical protein
MHLPLPKAPSTPLWKREDAVNHCCHDVLLVNAAARAAQATPVQQCAGPAADRRQRQCPPLPRTRTAFWPHNKLRTNMSSQCHLGAAQHGGMANMQPLTRHNKQHRTLSSQQQRCSTTSSSTTLGAADATTRCLLCAANRVDLRPGQAPSACCGYCCGCTQMSKLTSAADHTLMLIAPINPPQSHAGRMPQ